MPPDIAGSRPYAVRMEGVHKSYGSLEAVKGLDLAINRGECFGLLGPNGAGKSTTIRMLCGLSEPTRGRIAIAGESRRPLPAAVKTKLGLVPQELAFYPPLSARENLKFFGQVFGLAGRRLAARVETALEIAGLVGRDREPALHFSGGMKRRLNIAIGLLHDPDILILDEPTVGVDAQSRSAILSALEQLNQAGTTIIYCTHYMEEAERLCGRVAIIDHGRVIAEDSPRTLVRSLGDGIIELELAAPPDGASLERISQFGPVRLSGNDDTTASLHVSEPASVVADLLQSLREGRIPVRSLRLLEPNLEAVFLRLTGRQLRD